MFGFKTKYDELKKRFKRRAIVLMYHRICEPSIDPWELAISPDNFEQQLELLQKHYVVCSIPEIIDNLEKGKVKTNCFALTFDDGYRDNFQNAKPLLEKYNIPATFFIPTGNLLNEKAFWWDRLQEAILKTPELPETIDINFSDRKFSFFLGEESMLNKDIEKMHFQWVVPADPPTMRSQLFHVLWKILQPLPPEQIESQLTIIEAWAGKENALLNVQSEIMNANDVRALAGNNLFSIGLHTANHIALDNHSEEIQRQEILDNQVDLNQMIDQTSQVIAYPYGEYDSVTIKVAKGLGIRAGFSVEYNPVFADSNPFNLGRFHVKNWNAKQFEEKLAKWLTL
jgi:peptidoglycan/xylan/chitin deacetylase (PgdA/CDA1 family)